MDDKYEELRGALTTILFVLGAILGKLDELEEHITGQPPAESLADRIMKEFKS